jgi:hypothetical protein
VSEPGEIATGFFDGAECYNMKKVKTLSAIAEIEKLVFNLLEKDRAELVGKILLSLPLYADDGGLAEARRRDSEMDENPYSIITMEQLDDMSSNRFPFIRQ